LSPNRAPTEAAITMDMVMITTTAMITTTEMATGMAVQGIPMLTDALTKDSGLLRLLQLSSPALPIGAFAYSQGLEQAAELGWVQGEASLVRWLRGLLTHSLGAVDLPALWLSYQAWQRGDRHSAVRISRTVLALREASELRAEERHLGKALARVLAELDVPEAASFLETEDATHSVLYALAAANWRVPPEAALQAYAFAWTENQVQVAARLLPLGQMAAQRALSGVLGDIPPVAQRAPQIPETELGNSTAGLALACAQHEQKYTRLFRS